MHHSDAKVSPANKYADETPAGRHNQNAGPSVKGPALFNSKLM